jgi:formamidopyrimidine-DNA glycosylase
LKVALLDQSRIAGLGNIHAAEALYRSKLHPARRPATLVAAEWSRLAKAIRESIEFAIRREKSDEIEYVEEPGTDNPFLVYGREGESCKRCGSRFKSFILAGRTTFFCPGCQRRRAR